MELIFLGRGSAFNPKEGNTSAFFIEDKTLFLIDCGSSVFETLIVNDILKKIDKVNLFITHLHEDHIGSMGTFAEYLYSEKDIPLNIVLGHHNNGYGGTKYLQHIMALLKVMKINPNAITYEKDVSFDNKYQSFNEVRYVPTIHDESFDCYGIRFNTNNGIIYYSGDTNEIEPILRIIESGQLIDKIYVDVTTNDKPDNNHLALRILADNILDDLKSKFYCMHVNNDDCIKEAESLNFQVVTSLKQEQKTKTRLS